MSNAQIVEQLGLSFMAVGEVSNETVMAVMSAAAPFYIYNPAILSSPEGVPDYLMQAQAANNGRYQLSMSHYDGPLAADDYSKLVVLTEEEAKQFKALFDKSMEFYARQQITTRAFDELLDEFDALKASYDTRAALYEPEVFEALAA